MPPQSLQQKLAAIGQSKVLRFYDQLPPAGQKKLAAQIESLDLHTIGELIDTHVKKKAPIELPQHVEPVKAYPREPGAEHRQLYRDAELRGRRLLADGKIGAFLVAGGQGTRLGYDGPKGEFPVTPIRNKPLFRVFAEQLLAHSRDAGNPIPGD